MTATKNCVYCERDSEEVPLINLSYSGQDYWICPQHLPILIHKPSQLKDKLPGVDRLTPPDHAH
jgi:hypothetical protein